MEPTATSTPGEDGLMKISHALRSALRLAHEYRWVSDFLFSELSVAPFHKALPLAPAMFSAAVKNDLHQTVNVFPPAPSSGKALPPTLTRDLPADMVDYTLLHTAFVPLAMVDGVSVGYAFAAHHVPRENCMPANPLVPPFVARFALDVRQHELLFVHRGGKPPAIGIRCMRRASDSVARENIGFIVPDAPYAWPQLPTSSVFMLSHVETSTSPIDSVPSSSPTTDAFFDLTERAAPDRTPWLLSASGGLADGLPPAFNAQEEAASATSSAAFTATSRDFAASALRSALSGSFGGPAFRLDALDAMTGIVSTCFTGAFTSIYAPTENQDAYSITHRFVHAYYSNFLAVSCDGLLTTGADDTPQQHYSTDDRYENGGPSANAHTRSFSKEATNERDESGFWRTLLVDAFDFGVHRSFGTSVADNEVHDNALGCGGAAQAASDSMERHGVNGASCERPVHAAVGCVDQGDNSELIDIFDHSVVPETLPVLNSRDLDIVLGNDEFSSDTTATDVIRKLPITTGENATNGPESSNSVSGGTTNNNGAPISPQGVNKRATSTTLPMAPRLTTNHRTSSPTCNAIRNNIQYPTKTPFISTIPTAICEPNEKLNEQGMTGNSTVGVSIPGDERGTVVERSGKGIAMGNAGEVRREAVPLAPRVTPSSGEKQLSVARSKEQVIADRKRRNRLSAARSNERRRIWMAHLESDVQVARERVRELRSRLEAVRSENDALRRQNKLLNALPSAES